TLVLVPAVIANYFGATAFASINGFVFPVQLVIASTVPVSAGYLADLTGSYDVSFIALIGFAALAAVCALTTRPPRRQVPTEHPWYPGSRPEPRQPPGLPPSTVVLPRQFQGHAAKLRQRRFQ